MKLAELEISEIPARFLSQIPISHGPFPRTYLFTGPEYSGKEFTAIQFFKMLNCESSAPDEWCDACSSCQKINRLSSADMFLMYSFADIQKVRLFAEYFLKHPGLTVIQEKIKTEIYRLLIFLEPLGLKKKIMDTLYSIYEENLTPSSAKKLEEVLEQAEKASRNIPVEHIRKVQEKLYLTARELKYRLFLIKDAADLSREGANMLLKTIEEPPEDLIVILLSNRISGILPTIRSRSVQLRFAPYSHEERLKISEKLGHFSFDSLFYLENKDYSKELDLESMAKEEIAYYIDWLKQKYSVLSPIHQEKIKYLNELKTGMLYYNIPVNYIKNSLQIIGGARM